MRYITTLIVVMLLLSFASVTIGNDYIYNNGYYYDSCGNRYTLQREKCYYGRGCWYWCNRYVRVYPPAPVVAQAAPQDWRAAVVQMAENREAELTKLLALQEENKTFVESMKALGLSSPVSLPGAQGLPLGATILAPGGKPYINYRQVIQQGFNAEQGNTIFSVAQLSDVYNQNDLSVLFQQASQLATNAQQLAGDATTQFDSVVEKEAAGRQRIAEIIAKTQLVKEALRNTNDPKRVESEMRIGTERQNNGNAVEASQPPQQFEDLGALIQSKCIRCHNEASQKNKGVDLSKYDTFTQEQKDFVFETVASGKMPKGGARLSGKELRMFAN